jgi:hypothetical protein
MPRLKLTKSAIDALPTPAKVIVYWGSGCPGFGVKITPKARRVFIVLYRAGGARLPDHSLAVFVAYFARRNQAVECLDLQADDRVFLTRTEYLRGIFCPIV